MKKSYLLLHIAVLFAGFTGVFGKLITLNEGLLTWYRVLFSAIILLIIIKFMRIKIDLQGKEKYEMARVGMLITLHWLFFYASIKYSNISIAVVCFSMISFFTAIFKPIMDRSKKLVLSELLLSSITLLGISFIFHFDSTYKLGILLGVVSSAFGSLYTIYNERLASHYDSKVINYYQMLGGTIGLSLLMPLYLYFFPVETLLPDMKNLIYLLALSLFCTVGLYVAVTEVLKKLSAFTVNLSFNLEPIYSIIIAFWFFDEGKDVNFSFYIGLGFVLLSVLMQTFFSLRKNR